MLFINRSTPTQISTSQVSWRFGGASRSLERSSPVIRECNSIYSAPQSILSNWTLSFFSVELIPSMRASGRAARHGGTVSICELTQTGSPRRDRDACTRPPIYVHAHIHAKVDPPTGRRTLIQNRQYLPRSLVHSLNPSVSRPSIPLSLSFSPWPRSYRAVLPCAQ